MHGRWVDLIKAISWCWTVKDSGTLQGYEHRQTICHGLGETTLEMPVGPTEISQVDPRILAGGVFRKNRSEDLVGGLSENKNQGNHRLIAYQVPAVMIAWKISFDEHPLVRQLHAPAP
jgi:hypothetical protein